MAGRFAPEDIMRPTPRDEKIIRIASEIEEKEVVALTRRLVSIPSVYRNEQKAADRIFETLTGWGLKPRKVPVHGYGPCIVCSTGNERGRHFILNGHMDTVEVKDGWRHDPFGAAVEDGMMYGLGTLDMKAGLAAMMVALRTLAESGLNMRCPVKLQAVSGEEENAAGTRALIAEGHFRGASGVLVGEGIGGTGSITHGRRGGSYYDIYVLGRSAHGSTPDIGINAVSEAAKIIEGLNGMTMRHAHSLVGDDGEPLDESQVVLQVSGGDISYSVPDRCHIKMMRATVPGGRVDIIKELKEMIRGLKLRGKVKVVMQRSEGDFVRPYVTSPTSPIVRVARRWVEQYTGEKPQLVCGLSEADDNKIAEMTGLDVICYGPGEQGKLAKYHQPEEAVRISQLGMVARVYCATALDMVLEKN